MENLKIVTNEDGSRFVWLIVNGKAKEVFSSGIFALYILHSDETESLIETDEQLNEALENGADIGIEAGNL
jgi:hypothetical protein